MIYVSTFLSYSSADSVLVQSVADELAKRGILVWLDKNELEPGKSITEALDKAIKEQSTVTIFLSEKALESPWVEQELKTTLEIEEKIEHKEMIIPVFIGDPLELVKSKTLLSNRWLHCDGDRVDINYITVNEKKSVSINAREIAQQVASRIYSQLKISEQNEIIIYLDQRGIGKRREKPENIPQFVQRINAPILVFRPDHAERSRGEVLSEPGWEGFRDTIFNAISDSCKIVTWSDSKTIRIMGHAQLGIPFIMGQIFDRSSSADLYCYPKKGVPFTNRGQYRNGPLKAGNPNCEKINSEVTPIPVSSVLESISLYLGKKDFINDVLRYLKANPNSPSLVWIESGDFENSEEVMNYIADVVAVLQKYKDNNGVHSIQLFCTLPFHMIPLLSANLLHVVRNVIFMEYAREAGTDKELYIALKTLSQNKKI